MSSALQKRALEPLCRKQYVHHLLAHNSSIKVDLAAAAVQYLASGHSKEGMVMTNLHIVSGFNLGTALTHDNHTRSSCLAITKLNTEVLWI